MIVMVLTSPRFSPQTDPPLSAEVLPTAPEHWGVRLETCEGVIQVGGAWFATEETYEAARAYGVQRFLNDLEKHMPLRDSKHLAFVRTFPCFYCGAPEPSEAHHFGRHGMGTKADDRDTVPLCNKHHRLWHKKGKLPGGTRAEWLAKFRENAKLLLSEECF